MVRHAAAHVVLVLAVPLCALPAAAETPEDAWKAKVHPLVLAADPGKEAEFIVFLADQADVSAASSLPTKDAKGEYVFRTLSEHAARTQGPIVDELQALGVFYQRFWVANMILVRGTLDVAHLMADRGDVLRVDSNPKVRVPLPSTVPGSAGPSAIEWNISKVGAPTMWGQGYRGQGAVIAGQDTGYQWDHPALKGKYRGWNGTSADHNYNWHDAIHSGGGSCGPDTLYPCDDYGHGTHTMGTMVGDDGGSNQIGMAPSAKWIGCRNMDVGVGTPATYTECFQWLIAPTDLNNQNPDPSKAPYVINNSWGCPPSEGCSANTLKTVVENTVAAGIVVVVSAGNSGSSCSTVEDPPAIYAASFSVGATDSGDFIASFSSRGPVTVDGSGRLKPDVSAPGESVRSAYPTNSYTWMSGTSMAGPHVAGLVGLLISANPGYIGNVSQIESYIESTALGINTSETCGGTQGQIPNNVYGWGRIRAITPPTCPTITLSPSTLPGGTAGTPYSQTITASGGASPYTFAVTAGSLPPGLSLSTGGVLAGTPTASGTFNFTVTATDSNGCPGSHAYSLVIGCPAITLSPTALPAGAVGTSYSQTVTASGGTAPYTYTVSSGALPPGLSLSSGGLISGTPTTAGSYGFDVRAVDAYACSGTRTYALTINPAGCGTITLSPGSLPGGSVGTPYSQTITASGGTGSYSFSVSAGSLPPGLTLSSGGLISGTPTTGGSYSFTVRAQDSAGCSGTQGYTIAISGGGSTPFDFLVGQGLGPGNANRVRAFDASGSATTIDIIAYAAGTYGCNVASADVDGGSYDEILTGPGPGGILGPQVKAFRRDNSPISKINFYAYGTLKYGVNVAGGSVDADGYGEIATGAGPGAVFGPHVRGFNFDGSVLAVIGKISFFAYGTPRYGVNVATGSVDADAYAEILTGPGPSPAFGPTVRAFDYDGTSIAAIGKINFDAFTVLQYGVNVAAGDVDGDGYEEIAAARGPGSGPSFPAHFRGFNYDGSTIGNLTGFDTTPFAGTSYGGRVGVGDVNNAAAEDLECGAGRDPAANSLVQAFSYDGSGLTQLPATFLPFGTATYGVNVACGREGY